MSSHMDAVSEILALREELKSMTAERDAARAETEKTKRQLAEAEEELRQACNERNSASNAEAATRKYVETLQSNHKTEVEWLRETLRLVMEEAVYDCNGYIRPSLQDGGHARIAAEAALARKGEGK